MISISNNRCTAQIAPERGAIVTSLKIGEHELLYLDESTFTDPEKNVRGGIPVLFPLCGPLAEPSYTWQGQSYRLKQHGFARNSAWKVLEKRSDFARLELEDSEETRKIYPFSFRYILEFRANEDGLRIGQQIKNHGSSPMPLQFGFHPYFQTVNKDDLKFDLPATSYSDNKSSHRDEFGGFDFASAETDWSFPNPSRREAAFVDERTGLGVRLRYGDAYQALVFWTLKDRPFVCVEPWSSSRLAFPDGDDVHKLEPQEALETFVEVGLFERA